MDFYTKYILNNQIICYKNYGTKIIYVKRILQQCCFFKRLYNNVQIHVITNFWYLIYTTSDMYESKDIYICQNYLNFSFISESMVTYVTLVYPKIQYNISTALNFWLSN